ncbi:MAG TPA: sigma-70 family RNA polymerase sigma factor [Anaerolineae bacterium]|nr:sigma-70 family RNA polymerase sigma factor [Anaerolineae bacterium]
MDERQLIESARRGDVGAYDELVRSHQEAAFRAAYLVTRDVADAQDAAQEAFIRAYDALGRFDARRPFRPWILRIATNMALNRLKASMRRQAMAERFGAETVEREANPSIEARVLRRERGRRVQDAIRHLKPDDQSLLILRFFFDLSEAELAQTFDIAAGTIKSRLHRALAKLRDVIRKHDPDLLESDMQTQ